MDWVQRRSRALKVLATLIFAVLLLVAGAEFAMNLTTDDPFTAAGSMLIYRLPMLLYIAAIWMVRRAFAELARGALFDRVVPMMLKRVGWALVAGATANVFVSPLLLRYFDGLGSFVHFDPAAITLGIVGLMLVILARLLIQAATMRVELDEIF